MRRTIVRFAAATAIAVATLAGACAIAGTQATTKNLSAHTCGVAQNLNILDIGVNVGPKLC